MGTPSAQTANLPSFGQQHPQGSSNGQAQQPAASWTRWQNPEADKDDRRTIIQNSGSPCLLKQCLSTVIEPLCCARGQCLCMQLTRPGISCSRLRFALVDWSEFWVSGGAVFNLFSSRPKNQDNAQFRQKLPDFVRRLEEALYRTASTKVLSCG